MAVNPDTPNYHPLVRSVAKALRTRCAVQSNTAIVVGCSGGADSVALLRVLALLADRRKWGLKLIVGHVQHHLRDDAAEADASFVESLAKQLDLPYARRDIEPGKQPGNLEANARTMRYQALADIAGEHDATLVATAHHADDQLETLLMRMLRGASVQGLRGIAWRRPVRTAQTSRPIHLIRPMLAAPRAAVLDLLAQLDQPWQEDATNADTTRTRARLRHEVLPLLKSIQPDAANKAALLTDHFAELNKLVRSQAHRSRTRLAESGQLPRDHIRRLNPVVFASLLRTELIRLGVDQDRLSHQALKPILQAANDSTGGTRRFEFTRGICIEIDREYLRIHA